MKYKANNQISIEGSYTYIPPTNIRVKELFLYALVRFSLDQLIHIPCNLLVGDLGIDLCAGNRRIP